MMFSDKERTRLIEEKLPLLQEVVLKLPKKGESLDDLIQVGCVGLLKAIDQYNESTGEEFDHFAEFMITKEIKRYLRID